jgi:outer membrane protein TolC
MPRTAAFVAALVGLAGPALADAPAMRLGDIVAQAVQHNPTLLEAGADLGVAEGNLLNAEGLNDFHIDASGFYRRDQTQIIPGNPTQLPSHEDWNGQLDLSQPLPIGGSIGLRFVADYTTNVFAELTGTGSSTDNTQSTSVAKAPALELVWTQPLLRGFGYKAARGPLRKAREARSASALAKAGVAATIIRDVTLAYLELAYAAEDLSVRRDLAQAARDQLAVVDANIKAGKMPPSARAEVEVSLGQREDDALLSEKNLLDQSLLVRQLAGMPIGVGNSYITASDSLDAQVEVPTLDEAIRRGHDGNPQLLAAQANGRAARVDVEVTDNGILPQLDLSVVAGPTGVAPDWSSAFDQLSHFNSYTVQAQLVLHETLQRRGVHGAHMAAKEAWRKTQLTEADIRAQVDFAVVQLQSTELQAEKRVQTITPTSKSAALDLAAERARFEVGRSTNFDVLRRQDEVATSRLRLARARADLLRARAQLEAATGEILARYGVTIR